MCVCECWADISDPYKLHYRGGEAYGRVLAFHVGSRHLTQLYGFWIIGAQHQGMNFEELENLLLGEMESCSRGN